MPTITIQHIDDTDPAQFYLVTTGKNLGPFEVPSPVGYRVENRPHDDLMSELRWYLERFLDYPYPPETDRAARVQDALRTWGSASSEALFGSRDTGRLKALAIDEKQGNEHYAASTYHQLGSIAEQRRALDNAAAYYSKTVQSFLRFDASHEAIVVASSYRRLYDQAEADMQEKLKQRWSNNGFGEFPPAPGEDGES